MKDFTMTKRPSMVAAFCAPTSAELSQVRQAWTQAESARVHMAIDESPRTNGFLGSKGIEAVGAYLTDGASGVPPRGRPV